MTKYAFVPSTGTSNQWSVYKDGKYVALITDNGAANQVEILPEEVLPIIVHTKAEWLHPDTLRLSQGNDYLIIDTLWDDVVFIG